MKLKTVNENIQVYIWIKIVKKKKKENLNKNSLVNVEKIQKASIVISMTLSGSVKHCDQQAINKSAVNLMYYIPQIQ